MLQSTMPGLLHVSYRPVLSVDALGDPGGRIGVHRAQKVQGPVAQISSGVIPMGITPVSSELWATAPFERDVHQSDPLEDGGDHPDQQPMDSDGIPSGGGGITFGDRGAQKVQGAVTQNIPGRSLQGSLRDVLC